MSRVIGAIKPPLSRDKAEEVSECKTTSDSLRYEAPIGPLFGLILNLADLRGGFLRSGCSFFQCFNSAKRFHGGSAAAEFR
jgi:hypothetical protein